MEAKQKVAALLGVLAAAMIAAGARADADEAREIGMNYFSPVKASLENLRCRGLEPTGLRPVYPKDAECPPANSFFADRTRGDGSSRNSRFFHGHHGGIDIPAPEGTPILAIADGVIVMKKEDSNDGIGGIGIVVQHAPADTGLSVCLYSRYKHLKEMPALEIGERVKLGQTIGLTGSSGTAGKHYGTAGHAHLHLDAFISPDDRYMAGMLFFPPNGQMADPLAVYRGEPADTASVRALPEEAKTAVIPYMTHDGKTTLTANRRLIWPYACKAGAPVSGKNKSTQ